MNVMSIQTLFVAVSVLRDTTSCQQCLESPSEEPYHIVSTFKLYIFTILHSLPELTEYTIIVSMSELDLRNC